MSEPSAFKMNPNAREFVAKIPGIPEEKQQAVPASDWYEDAMKREEVITEMAGEESSEAASGSVEGAEAVSRTSGKGTLADPDPRPHLNIVFIGHVDAGKSTTCGNILYLSGNVDERTIEKYEREAKAKNRESWFLAFIMDTNEEERQKGKTVEVGRATFQTKARRYTILDAPGHKSFVPNMIAGAAQADIGVLIISARRGEFETGFDRGGQTREHALLAKTLGVRKMVVAINKMDDPTCEWSEERYNDIKKKILPFLKGCGFNPQTDIDFVPISGLGGNNIMAHVSRPGSTKLEERAKWYTGDSPTLLEILDSIDAIEGSREVQDVRVPISAFYKDSGVYIIGKLEAGKLAADAQCLIMPQKKKVRVAQIYLDEDEVGYCYPGENIRARLVGMDEEAMGRGMVLCTPRSVCPVVSAFRAQVKIVDLLETKPIITAGYSCVLHAHTTHDEVTVVKLISTVDKKSKRLIKNPVFIKSECMVTIELKLQCGICLDAFDHCPGLGRFTLRDEGKTIAFGRVIDVL